MKNISGKENLFFLIGKKPKDHFETHTESTIRSIGPLPNIDSCRYEARHQTLIAYSKVNKSKVNVCYSMAKKVQVSQAFFFQRSKVLKTKKELGPVKKKFISRICTKHFNSQDIATILGKDVFDDIHVVNWFSKNSTQYRPGTVIFHQYEDIFPSFLEINLIVYDKNSLLLICKKYETIGFDEHYHAWLVKAANETGILIPYDKISNKLNTSLHCTVKVGFEEEELFHIVFNDF